MANGWVIGAVGVETWEEAHVLHEHGVTRATGHLFGSAFAGKRGTVQPARAARVRAFGFRTAARSGGCCE